jgi:hypothetical protein
VQLKPDRGHQPYRLVGFHQVQYRGAKHDPGDDLQHRPGAGTRGTAARINGTAAAVASTATRLSKFIAATIRSS